MRQTIPVYGSGGAKPAHDGWWKRLGRQCPCYLAVGMCREMDRLEDNGMN